MKIQDFKEYNSILYYPEEFGITEKITPGIYSKIKFVIKENNRILDDILDPIQYKICFRIFEDNRE